MPNLKRTKEKKGTGGAQRAQMRLYCMPPPSVDVDDKVLFGAFPTRPFSIGTIPLVRLSWSSSRVSLAPARQANSALRLDPLLCRRALAWYPTSRGWRTAKQGRAGQGRADEVQTKWCHAIWIATFAPRAFPDCFSKAQPGRSRRVLKGRWPPILCSALLKFESFRGHALCLVPQQLVPKHGSHTVNSLSPLLHLGPFFHTCPGARNVPTNFALKKKS